MLSGGRRTVVNDARCINNKQRVVLFSRLCWSCWIFRLWLPFSKASNWSCRTALYLILKVVLYTAALDASVYILCLPPLPVSFSALGREKNLVVPLRVKLVAKFFVLQCSICTIKFYRSSRIIFTGKESWCSFMKVALSVIIYFFFADSSDRA